MQQSVSKEGRRRRSGERYDDARAVVVGAGGVNDDCLCRFLLVDAPAADHDENDAAAADGDLPKAFS
jgi:hypothetical protein